MAHVTPTRGNPIGAADDLEDVPPVYADTSVRPFRAAAKRPALRLAGSAAAALLAAALLVGCGGDEPVDLSPLAAQGRDIATERGCNSCHGADGGGGVGPAWQGLHGSDVELEDGTTVVADAAYLATAITDPDAQIVAGYTVRMPVNDLTPDEVDAVVAYIQELP